MPRRAVKLLQESIVDNPILTQAVTFSFYVEAMGSHVFERDIPKSVKKSPFRFELSHSDEHFLHIDGPTILAIRKGVHRFSSG